MGTKIESIGVFRDESVIETPTFDLIRKAGESCIEKSQYGRERIDVLIHVSIYRSNEFVEPAMATYIQRDLGINHQIKTSAGPKTFSFDLMNGSMGFLQGCQVLSAMFATEKAHTGLLVSGNSKKFLGTYVGPKNVFYEVGVAVLLDDAHDPTKGFSSFFFRHFPQYSRLLESHLEYRTKKWLSIFTPDPKLEDIYLEIFSQGVIDYLYQENQDLDSFDFVIPPQVSAQFVAKAANKIGGNAAKFVDITKGEGDLMTASEAMAIKYLLDRGLAKPGGKALIVNVGSGLQFGCATYMF
jgi:3-oxoacyl-[acyl-carrier-protein] synthase III